MQSQSITFRNDAGLQLSARIDRPGNPALQFYALFAHCFTCTKNISAVRHIARALTDRGVGVFSFDFTGLGQSEGEFAEGDFSNQAADLVAGGALHGDRTGRWPDIDDRSLTGGEPPRSTPPAW